MTVRTAGKLRPWKPMGFFISLLMFPCCGVRLPHSSSRVLQRDWWLHIEKPACQHELAELPPVGITLGDCNMKKITIEIWKVVENTYDLPFPISALTSILFIPSHMDTGFRNWSIMAKVF